MDVRKRMFRRPASTALWTALLLLASLLLGVAASIYASAKGVPDALGKQQTTIALQKIEMVEQEDGSFSFDPKNALLYEEDIEYLRSLPQVKDVDFRYLSGAYIEPLTARLHLTSLFGNMQSPWRTNDSYQNVLVLGTVEQVWDASYESIETYDLSAFGHGENIAQKVCGALVRVDEVLSMHPDFPLFGQGAADELYNGKVRVQKEDDELYNGKVRVRYITFDESKGNFFKVGSRYAFYGEYDSTVSGFNEEPMPDQGVPFAPHISSSSVLDFLSCYQEGDSLVSYRSEYAMPEFDALTLESQGPMVTKVLTREDRMPVVKEWNGTSEELLSDPYWSDLQKQNEMYLHSFPVLGTNCIESMYGFVSNKTKIVEGRTFTEQEYKSGAKVLILNESIAHAAGLSVGDTLNVRQFRSTSGNEQGNNSVFTDYQDIERNSENNPNLGKLPFFNEQPRDAETFTIVGLYRQENEWENSLCSFTPNTIFMPRAAQIEDALGGPSKITGYQQVTHMMYHVNENGETEPIGERTFEEEIIEPGLAGGLYMSIILKNGSIDAFKERIEKDSTHEEHTPVDSGNVIRYYTKGIGGHTFLCFDQGYDDVKDSIGAVLDSARKLALLALGGAALIFAAYMLLYQGLEKKTLGVMRSLGASKQKVRRYLFVSGLLLAGIGIVLGTALSGAVSGLVSEKLAELIVLQAKDVGPAELFTEMLAEGDMPIWGYVLAGLIELLAAAAALFVQSVLVTNRKIRKMMGK